MNDRSPDDLRRELAREQDRLSMLDGERARTRERIAALRAELAATSQAGTETEITAPRSPGDKVALFRSLFRGRIDVFARRWVNERKRTAGYAPACSHEWVRAVLASQLFVEKAGLSSPLLNALKRTAAFQNPGVWLRLWQQRAQPGGKPGRPRACRNS